MKNIFCLLLCLLSLSIFSQKVSILDGGANAGEDFLRPNPDVFINYKGEVDNSLVVGNPWTRVSNVWSARPLNQLVNPNAQGVQDGESDRVETNVGIPTFGTRWLNKDNTVNATMDQKKVTLSMVVTRKERKINKSVFHAAIL